MPPPGRKPTCPSDTRAAPPARRAGLASDAGDTLIEVLISAFLIGLIVVGIFSGLNSTNRSTSIDRARSQADALAEQNEEQLRSEPIKKLDELESHPEIKTVTAGKNVYTIETSATYFPDASSTSSCTSSTETAIYLQTTSKVTSPLIGAGKSVEENGIISPPAGSALIVQVQESGTALSGAKVVATGPSPSTGAYELETSSKGCAILAVPPGEYNINVSKSGYVTANGFENTHEDASTTRSVYLAAETTAKEGYNIGQAGQLQVSFENPSTKSTAEGGDSFVAFNNLMTSYRKFITEPVGTYKPTLESPYSIFPFTSNYTVYAGTCESDAPSASIIEANKTKFLATVIHGKAYPMTTIQPPVNIKVLESNKGQLPEKALQNATARMEDTGCKTVHESKTTSTGGLSHPSMPFGTYSLCVAAKVGAKNRKYTHTITNSSVGGTALQTIYLGEEGEVVATASCP